MTVVMAGCGDLGTEAGLRMAAAGRRVVGLRRNPGVLPEPIEGRAADLVRAVPQVPADTRIVVIALTPDSRDAAGYRAAYVTAPGHVLDGLERAGVQPDRVLMVSSTAVYGAVDDGRRLDEASPLAPRPVTGEILVEAEDAVRSRVPEAIMLRLTGLYGPGRDRLIRRARDEAAGVGDADGAGGAAGAGGVHDRFTNRIHRDDAAEAIVHLTTRVAVPERVYLGTDDDPAPYSEVVGFIAGLVATGPSGLVATGSAGADGAGPGPDEPVRRRAGKRFDNDRLRSSGFRFAYPTYREGYAAVLGGAGVRHR